MNELERIVGNVRKEVERRRELVAPKELERQAQARAESRTEGCRFRDALSRPGLSVIAEHKRRSPSAGLIRAGIGLEQVVCAYERGGAAALSVLTESLSFGGSLDDLRAARAATALPILRKDFVIDGYQIDEAVLAGADAVLLIVAALADEPLRRLLERARSRRLGALVEVHDERELERALQAGAEIVGINNRDLTTLVVDPSRTFELAPKVPDAVTVVAESGFGSRQQLEPLPDVGVDAVLVGEALMRAPNIERACRELCGG